MWQNSGSIEGCCCDAGTVETTTESHYLPVLNELVTTCVGYGGRRDARACAAGGAMWGEERGAGEKRARDGLVLCRPFFRYYKADLYRPCPFWTEEDAMCSNVRARRGAEREGTGVVV